MTPVLDRVVEVWVPDGSSSGGRFGSGYLIGDGRVLTAAHLLAGVGACEVRPVGAEWTQGEVAWSDSDSDLAVLRAAHRSDAARLHTRFGRFAGGARAPIRAVGLPIAQRRSNATPDIRDVEEIVGEVAPLSGTKSGVLTVHVTGSVPSEDPTEQSPWGGMSGAALFSGPLLVGVVSQAPAGFGTDRLEAAAIATVWADAGFQAAIGAESAPPARLEAVEDTLLSQDALADPYRPVGRFRPSSLLRPEYGVVAFRGRSEELVLLEQWLSETTATSVMLMTGPGGAGKSRLAFELCKRLRADGWIAGLLRRDTSEEQLRRLARISSPLLVVVDDVESRGVAVATLLEAFAQAEGSPLRLLLLAREMGDWWERLRLRARECDDASSALVEAMRMRLSALDTTKHARRAAFVDALRTFARYVDNADDGALDASLDALDLTDAIFDNALVLHMTALSMLLSTRATSTEPPVRDELIETMLEREADYWMQTSRDAGLMIDGVVQQRSIGVATLVSAHSEREASELLRAVPDLADASHQERRRVARWLRDLYPPGDEVGADAGEAETARWFSPLQPDLLGEALVARVLPDVLDDAVETSSIIDGLLARITQTHAVELLSTLNRSARDHHSAEQALRRCLQTRFASLWRPAIDAAQRTGDPLASLLAHALIDSPMPQEAREILAEIPRQTMTLRKLAFVAAAQANIGVQQAIRAARAADPSKPPPTSLLVEMANTIAEHSRRMADVGQIELALDEAENAVKLWRILRSDEGQPELAGHYDLAGALTSLASQLANDGQHERAEQEINEAVTLYEELIELDPAYWEGDLAHALQTRSAILRARGSLRKALDDIREAVRIWDELADRHPGEYLPELADTSRELVETLLELVPEDPEYFEEAGDEGKRSLELSYRLAERDPLQYRVNVALILRVLARGYAIAGETTQALDLIDRELNTWSELEEAQPGVLVHERARTLTAMAQQLLLIGRDDLSAIAATEAVELFDGLVGQHPYLKGLLANALETQGEALAAGGAKAKARAARARAKKLRRD